MSFFNWQSMAYSALGAIYARLTAPEFWDRLRAAVAEADSLLLAGADKSAVVRNALAIWSAALPGWLINLGIEIAVALLRSAAESNPKDA